MSDEYSEVWEALLSVAKRIQNPEPYVEPVVILSPAQYEQACKNVDAGRSWWDNGGAA